MAAIELRQDRDHAAISPDYRHPLDVIGANRGGQTDWRFPIDIALAGHLSR